jgi:hypothetical protein
VAGITVGVVAAVVFVIGVILMARYMRRKEELEQQRKRLKISKPIPIGGGSEYNARSLDEVRVGWVPQVPMTKVARKSFSDWRLSGNIETEGIGIAMTPGTAQTIGTDGRSIKTTSRLLPERPAILLQPAPRPGNPRLERARPSSAATEFEDVD